MILHGISDSTKAMLSMITISYQGPIPIIWRIPADTQDQAKHLLLILITYPASEIAGYLIIAAT